MKQPAIFLMGPTAAGKTDLAIELLQYLPLEIISVDSAMIYRGMDIGTGKPSRNLLEIAPHHLINIKDPNEPYSAAEFRHDALKCMAEITSRGRIPLLVGGTMLYFKALQQGLSALPAANVEVRAKLLEEARLMGWNFLYDRLRTVDPESALRIHPNDPQRLQRALEVFEITGRPMSEFFSDSGDDLPYQIYSFVIMPQDLDQRKIQSERIAVRFHAMLKQGLIDEAKILYKSYGLEELLQKNEQTYIFPALRSVGYRQIFEFLAGQYNYDEMILRALTATRQLAKRQITWLRSLLNLNYLSYPTSIKDENNISASLQSMVNCVSRVY